MREHRDTMEWLAAADPLTGGERLRPDEEREAEALLTRLLATPVEERRARRARPRRLALAGAGVAAVAAVAFVAVNLVDSDTPGPGVVERAVAAVTRDDVVYHVVERTRATLPADLGRSRTYFQESWHTTDGRLRQKVFAPREGDRGRMVQEYAGRRLPGRRGGTVLAWNRRSNVIMQLGFARGRTTVPSLDQFADPAAQLRELEGDGRLQLAGTTRIDGRRAYRLDSGLVRRPQERNTIERMVFLVDAETYLPLARHHSVDSATERPLKFFTRFLAYERLPMSDRTARLLALGPHPGARCLLAGQRLERDVGFSHRCAP